MNGQSTLRRLERRAVDKLYKTGPELLNHISYDVIRQGNVEACKILKYPEL